MTTGILRHMRTIRLQYDDTMTRRKTRQNMTPWIASLGSSSPPPPLAAPAGAAPADAAALLSSGIPTLAASASLGSSSPPPPLAAPAGAAPAGAAALLSTAACPRRPPPTPRPSGCVQRPPALRGARRAAPASAPVMLTETTLLAMMSQRRALRLAGRREQAPLVLLARAEPVRACRAQQVEKRRARKQMFEEGGTSMPSRE